MDLPIGFFPNQEIDFKNIRNVSFKDTDAIQITIQNSIISECHFDNVNLSHCDLISTKVYSSIFNKVNFDGADIFSMWFSDCQFIDADFTSAGIEDITFINCSFINCNFDRIGLKHCVFTNTQFENIRPNSSTLALNNYEKCIFRECKFKGSFHYQIFKDCQFNNVLMEDNVLKYNYGLGKISGIIYFHKPNLLQEIDILKENMIIECSQKQRFIDAVTIDYNFADKINPELAIRSIKAIGVMIEKGMLLRNDELIFLKNLYHHFYVNGLIAPIVLYKLFEELNKIYIDNNSQNIVIAKSKESLSMISNSLYFDFSDFCEHLRASIKENTNYIAPIYIKMHYEQEPQISLDLLLNQYFPDTFCRTATELGSFFEYLEGGQNSLEILKIFIQLLGISAPVIYSELKAKKKKKQPETSIKKDVEINITQLRNQKDTENLIQKTCQLINSTDILTGNQQGYSNDNIKEIKITYRINIQT